MLVALNIVLATAVVVGMVALFIHAIRSDHRHHQLQAEASSHAEALRANAPVRRAPARRVPQRHAAAVRSAPVWRRDGEFSPSRG